MSKTDGGPAFPCPHPSTFNEGMTLRDWFAGQVLAGLRSNPRDDYAQETREAHAVEAYRQADAMLGVRASEEDSRADR